MFFISFSTLVWGCATPEEQTLCSAQLLYEPAHDENTSRVEAVGDFNGWSTGSTPLRERDDGTFSVTFETAPGDYTYRLRVDETLLLDPLAALTRFDAQGREQSLLRVADCRLPQWEVLEATATTDGTLTIEAAFEPGLSGDPLDLDSVTATFTSGRSLSTDRIFENEREIVTVSASGLDEGKHTVRLSGGDSSGLQALDIVLPLWVETSVFDWSDALIYQIVIDRFAPSGEPLDVGLPRDEALTRRHGGDLAGLRSVIESGYFDALGVRALWLSPLYDNPDDLWPWYMGLDSSAYHGYWPVSTRTIEPTLGDEEAARALIEAAHERQIRVILDVVPNHVHIEHPYFEEHRGDGWFNGLGDCVCGSTCSWSEDIDHCWFSEYLADLRWKNPEVAHRIVDDTVFWLEAFDLDGLRIDAIPMMPLLATREIVDAVHRFERGPVGIHLLGETYTGPGDYQTITRALGPFGLDGQFDFPLLWEIRRVLAHGEGTMTGLDQVVRESERAWAEAGGGDRGRAIMSPFIGNHDVPRFISEAAGDDVDHPIESPPDPPDHDEPYQRLLLAHVFTLTLPGAPVLYYGDEIGMAGATDPDNRRPMRFGEDLDGRQESTLEAVSRLGRLRACLASLRRGIRETLFVDDDVYTYVRDARDESPAVIALNRGDQMRTISIDLPEELEDPADGLFVDALSGVEVSVNGRSVSPIDLQPLSAMVLVPAESPCARP